MITIASARRQDIAAVARLLEEMDRFYGSIEFPPIQDRVTQIETELFGVQPPAAVVLLAWSGDNLVGLASYSFLWPAVGITRCLYLKELYVKKTDRGVGVGTALMRAVAQIAASHRCSRLEWATDHDNVDAQHFYGNLRAPLNPGKVHYRLDEAGIRELARGHEGP